MQLDSSKSKLQKGNQELFDMMKQYMDGKFGGLEQRLDNVRDEVSQNTIAIGDLSGDVNKNKETSRS